jgi:serpin B
VLTRRDTLRLLGLAVLATSSATLAACGAATGSGPSGAAADPGLVVAHVRRSPGDPAQIGQVVAGLHHLAGGLYAQLAGAVDGNLACSPYSVAVALAMTRNGALGTTAEEMDGVLGVKDLAGYNDGVNALTRAVEGLAGSFPRGDGDQAVIALDAANALFGDGTMTWSARFLDALAASYGAGMRTVDFVGDAEGARTRINSWTAERTSDKIPEILPKGVVDELTRLVLVNALYFKAPWQQQFKKEATLTRPFHRPSGAVDVPMMAADLNAAGYAEGDSWQAVRLPYFGGTLAMTVVLPADGQLPAVESAVASGGLAAILTASASMSAVRLSLPRWTFRTAVSLKDVLSALGMPTAFTDAADLTAMTDDHADLHIGAVLHQTFVAVDEQGTEAAAATAVTVDLESAIAEPVVVTVDRPFLFVIHDATHLTPHFVGRVADPTAA